MTKSSNHFRLPHTWTLRETWGAPLFRKTHIMSTAVMCFVRGYKKCVFISFSFPFSSRFMCSCDSKKKLKKKENSKADERKNFNRIFFLSLHVWWLFKLKKSNVMLCETKTWRLRLSWSFLDSKANKHKKIKHKI
jgi:hypothetical protein